MNKDMTFCLPKDIYNPICRTCIRRRSHPQNEKFNNEILSLAVFSPRKAEVQGYHCDFEIKEK